MMVIPHVELAYTMHPKPILTQYTLILVLAATGNFLVYSIHLTLP